MKEGGTDFRSGFFMWLLVFIWLCVAIAALFVYPGNIERRQPAIVDSVFYFPARVETSTRTRINPEGKMELLTFTDYIPERWGVRLLVGDRIESLDIPRDVYYRIQPGDAVMVYRQCGRWSGTCHIEHLVIIDE